MLDSGVGVEFVYLAIEISERLPEREIKHRDNICCDCQLFHLSEQHQL